MQKFRVFSADWEYEIEAEDYVEASIEGLKIAHDAFGTDLSIGRCVASVNLKTDETEVILSAAVFQEIGRHDIAAALTKFFGSRAKLRY